MRSTVWMPSAFSIRRIIWPIIADSLESFEETTTAACSWGDPVSASAAATQSDCRMFATGHLHADHQDRFEPRRARCRLLFRASSPPATTRPEPFAVPCGRVPACSALYDGEHR